MKIPKSIGYLLTAAIIGNPFNQAKAQNSNFNADAYKIAEYLKNNGKKSNINPELSWDMITLGDYTITFIYNDNPQKEIIDGKDVLRIIIQSTDLSNKVSDIGLNGIDSLDSLNDEQIGVNTDRLSDADKIYKKALSDITKKLNL